MGYLVFSIEGLGGAGRDDALRCGKEGQRGIRYLASLVAPNLGFFPYRPTSFALPSNLVSSSNFTFLPSFLHSFIPSILTTTSIFSFILIQFTHSLQMEGAQRTTSSLVGKYYFPSTFHHAGNHDGAAHELPTSAIANAK